ncbi:uncharacterized protein EV422DRAFT_623008 [Fimicolochytrium jonesii]|uniref:uncharacterized protein n=1 Tax=Fimicolochytrium jonesii TaxID=1396493 RepID=UPI0022FE30CD|nr:uncharacterized protein EV422DRAFT_623008 [Fimicolochytrium jonesii]KAI8816936.1 hypothetical protein EV422DRAFT_623008 [Fimicolochytrium jonesii]
MVTVATTPPPSAASSSTGTPRHKLSRVRQRTPPTSNTPALGQSRQQVGEDRKARHQPRLHHFPPSLPSLALGSCELPRRRPQRGGRPAPRIPNPHPPSFRPPAGLPQSRSTHHAYHHHHPRSCALIHSLHGGGSPERSSAGRHRRPRHWGAGARGSPGALQGGVVEDEGGGGCVPGGRQKQEEDAAREEALHHRTVAHMSSRKLPRRRPRRRRPPTPRIPHTNHSSSRPPAALPQP